MPASRIASLFLLILSATSVHAEKLSAYVGTYTDGESEGIYHLSFDTETGEISDVTLAAKSEDPSFLAIHPNGKTLYAVNEKSGHISSFSMDAETKKLTLLNQKPSGGAAPCHLVVDDTGRNVLVANYAGGSVSNTRVNRKTSKLGKQTAHIQHQGSSVDAKRQATPHAHSINLDASNRFAVVADLGLDKLIVYAFDAQKGTLNEHSSTSLKPGSGPRHFAFHPNGKHAYVINEMHKTINVFNYDATAGTLADIQTVSTVPIGHEGGSTAEVRVSANGKFVFGSNRGHDSIATYQVDDANGKLTLVEIEPIGGKEPRNFALDPSGRFLLAEGQKSDNIVVFEIDQESGALTRTKHEAKVPTPVCIRFVK